MQYVSKNYPAVCFSWSNTVSPLSVTCHTLHSTHLNLSLSSKYQWKTRDCSTQQPAALHKGLSYWCFINSAINIEKTLTNEATEKSSRDNLQRWEYRDLGYNTLYTRLSTFPSSHFPRHDDWDAPAPPSSMLFLFNEINGMEGLDDPPHPLWILIMNHRLGIMRLVSNDNRRDECVSLWHYHIARQECVCM